MDYRMDGEAAGSTDQPFVSSEVETLGIPLVARPSTMLGTNGCGGMI